MTVCVSIHYYYNSFTTLVSLYFPYEEILDPKLSTEKHIRIREVITSMSISELFPFEMAAMLASDQSVLCMKRS